MDDNRRLLRKAARNLYRVVEDPEFWTPAFSRAFFEWCEAQAYEVPESVMVRGQLALELAGKTGDVHTIAKAHGVMNVLRSAERELDETRERLAELREAVSVSVPTLYKAPSLASISAP